MHLSLNQSSVEEKSIQRKALKLTKVHANPVSVDAYLKRFRLMQVALATLALTTFVVGGAFLKMSQYLGMDIREPVYMLMVGTLLGGLWMKRVAYRELYFTPLNSLPDLCREVEAMGRLSSGVRDYVLETLARRPLRTFDVARMNVLFQADESARVGPGGSPSTYDMLAQL